MARPPGKLWTCQLIASPPRIYPHERLRLTVILHHPDLDGWSGKHGPYFVDEIRRITFDSPDPRIADLLRLHADQNPAVIPNMPALPPGDYEVTARVDFIAHEIFIVPPPQPDPKNPMPGEGGGKVQYDIPETIRASTTFSVVNNEIEASVRLQRSSSRQTNDQALAAAIRNRTDAISFPRYQTFINQVFGEGGDLLKGVTKVRDAIERNTFSTGDAHKPILGSHAYTVLKLATQAFLTLEAGVSFDPHLFAGDIEAARFDDPSITVDGLKQRLKHYLVHPEAHGAMLPYLDRIARAFLSLDEMRHGDGIDAILHQRLTQPSMIELIWSYWEEQGMLVQTMNAIARRFQNRRTSERDPLGELEFDTLRPLNNILWGYIQDEQNRLTVLRRAHEYHHHYGLSLEGKAVANLYPADSRSKFLEAFHNLLYRTELFYREDRDTTMIADAFPLLNALREVHLLLAEGAGNQFGDLTWTARCEMLMAQWMLARREMRDFLRGRYAVPYQEGWMGAVDSMKRLQGWDDTSITHYHDLAVTGERILLSVRYGDWSNSNNIEEQAKNWARDSKPEIQRYLFAYRTVTGVDLSSTTTDTRDARTRSVQPSTLLQRRMTDQRARAIAPPSGELRALRPPSPMGVDRPMRPLARLPRSGTGGDG